MRGFQLTIRDEHARHYVFAIFAVAYGFITFSLSTRLWYWWDEWTILRSQESQYFGLLQGHFGNFFPLGRLVFLIETQLFGNNYSALVLINSLLVSVSCYFVWRTLFIAIKPSGFANLLIVAGLIGFATSAGVVFDVLWGFQVAWFLSIFFAVTGPYLVIVKGYKPVTALYFLIPSWLSFNSNLLPASILMLSLLYLAGQRPLKTTWLLNYLSVAAGALLLTITGLVLARANPSVEPRAQDTGVNFFEFLSNFPAVAAEAVSGFVLWLLSPVSLVLPSKPEFFQQLGPTLAASPRLIALIIVTLTLLTLVVLGTVRWQAWSRPIAFALPIALLLLLISSRGNGAFDSTFNLRYAPSALLPSVLFWVVLLTAGLIGQRLSSKIVASTMGTLMVVTSAFGLFTLVIQRPDPIAVFGRLDQASQFEYMSQCSELGIGKINSAPFQSYNAMDFCNLYTKLE